MDSTHDFDVTIVGAGIAGSALALALADSDLRIALVESQPVELPQLPDEVCVTAFDTRVSALTPRSRAYLQQLDCWQHIADYRLCPYSHMTVWDAQGTGQIEFDRADVGTDALGYIVENRCVVNALLTPLLRKRNVEVISGAGLAHCEALSGGGIRAAMTRGESVSCSLLVAADGARSKVRSLLDFKTREWDYGHRAVVATVELEHAHENTAWQRFMSSGPLAILPLPGSGQQHFASIVWSAHDELADELLALQEEQFCTQLAAAIEHRLGAVLACSRRAGFPLRQRHAIDYVQPSVALVGDAAHTIHPLAGQGVNLALQDVAALAAEILKGQANGIDPGQLALLQRYQRQRKGENLLMMAAMDGFKRLFEEPALPVRWLRNEGMRRVDRMLPLKQQLMRHAMGMG
ncbi:MAG: UbiH/UbiF/VisC/COQ6 family ubiquinone biosynthesis hydroxylase [Gammaproteobacteria bacterium]|jgi:2-octaprenylphenol hydroxylase|nr:UbiH/UbiF/VisC/COQ6 family ubiquinone biosynthesis hydroxylase [Gammaproteobacteria bacterium]